MANADIERIVDQQIASGRISRDMRDTYIRDWETGLGDQLLRGSDYTKKTQELANARREAEAWLQAERQKIQSERNELKNWYGQVQGELSTADRIREEKEAINTRLAAAEQALRDYQIHDQVTLPPINNNMRTTPTPTPTPTTTPTNPAQPAAGHFLTRDEFDRAVSGFMVLTNKVDRIRNEHLRLFGEPLEDDLVAHFQQTGQDPEEYWKVKHAVENRKVELAQKNKEAEKAALREELRRELQMEYASDPSRLVGAPSGQKGGLTPLMEQYSGSRALAHSQNHANDAAAKGDFIPPEKKHDIPSTQERISAASRLFHENYDLNGNPISEKGRQLSQRYQG